METIFGPVPSRRLGRSIGVNNVPPKHCTYACVYCQLGKALWMESERSVFYDPQELAEAAETRVKEVRARGEVIDYLTIVPDGEPTLDAGIRRLIILLKRIGIPVAVITNGSLLGRADVREDLAEADWVSVKIDAVSDSVWRAVNRPHKRIDHAQMLSGIEQFAGSFNAAGGKILVTESMLIEGMNTAAEELEAAAECIRRLAPRTAYLAVPTRPPAESWAVPASEASLARAYSIFTRVLEETEVEHLTGYEGSSFSASGDARSDLLSITAVHPMRRDAVEELLQKDNSSFAVVEELLSQKILSSHTFYGHTYYVRRFTRAGTT